MIVLHILWMILRVLLIILGILLGLVLLILLLVLFCPVRYRVSVSKETERIRDITAQVSVSWLFRGIRLLVSYQDGKMNPDAFLFGISLKKVKGFLEKRRKGKRPAQTTEKESLKADDALEVSKNTAPDIGPAEEREEKTEKPSYRVEERYSESYAGQREPKPAGKEKSKSEKKPSGSFFGRLLDRIDTFFEKLGEKLEGLEQKKDALDQKVESWTDFLTHPSVKEALSLVWKKLWLLIRHILPVKMAGECSFGFKDPSITGRVLMIMGMTIPLHKNSVALYPDFEGENHIEGSLWLKGRIYGIVFLVTVLRILIDKNIRYVYRRFKNKEPGTVPRTK